MASTHMNSFVWPHFGKTARCQADRVNNTYQPTAIINTSWASNQSCVRLLTTIPIRCNTCSATDLDVVRLLSSRKNERLGS